MTIVVSLFTEPPPEASEVMDDVKRVVGGPFSAGVGDRGLRWAGRPPDGKTRMHNRRTT